MDDKFDLEKFLANTHQAIKEGRTTGSGILAEQFKLHRIFEFKSADTLWEYNVKYGHKNLAHAILQNQEMFQKYLTIGETMGFGKEHKMKVLISSSNYPRYMCNPNIPLEDGEFFRSRPNDGQTYTYQGQTYSPRIAENSIYFSDSLASRIDFPIYGINPQLDLFKIAGEEYHNSLQLKPNPTSDLLVITKKVSGSGLISIYNNLGQMVLQSSMEDLQLTLNVQNLAKGVYQLHYIDNVSEKQQISGFIKN